MVRTAVILATGVWKAGREQRAMTPDPVDPLDPGDPLDPLVNSKLGICIVRVVIFGLDGAPA